MTLRRSSFAIIAALLISVPSASAAEKASKDYEARDVGQILETLKIREPVSNLKAMVASPDGKHYGFAFDDGKEAKVFLDGKSMYSAKGGICLSAGFLFRMTDDGHLLYSTDCFALYVDAQSVFKSNEVLQYGHDSVAYENGKLYFPSGHEVMEYDIAKGKTKALYSHPSAQVLYLRKTGKRIAYSVQDSLGKTFLYLDGKKVSSVEAGDAFNFLLTEKGDVYYFVAGTDRYYVYKNKGRYFAGLGNFGYLFDDQRGNVWNLSYLDGIFGDLRLFLYKGRSKKNLLTSDVGNLEGLMAFQGGQFAARGKNPGTVDDFYLMKNGKLIGDKFAFTAGNKDYNGLFFAENGKVYMRNHDSKRWQAYEDGKVILSDAFKQVWLVMKGADGKAVVFGTK